ncbi:probable glucuronoxylan glucuronosyltransferase IRX7 [Magnolia sinica]|uniref:probable glucuronoxylan glucuronosyltransferase IRX7 n=1 Tax=Magnolia sinica TaxID=86752 RepID=UPI002657D256|nr:probable glucuronoxylan glucuronosyltransferase IRX7 [Magnolia sinica]
MVLDFRRNSENREFYPKMKILHRQNTRNIDKSISPSRFNRYFRWVLWFSLSFYFISSYLISSSSSTTTTTTTVIPPSKTTTFSASRVLIENPTKTNVSKSQSGLMASDLKVYVYDLPSEYNRDWLSNERCSSHLFAAEVAIHEALMESEFRTLDPWEADFFFVPVYVSCNFSTVNGFPAIGHARRLLASAVHLISSELPFWNRSDGSDHVFVASHDYGACFHAMEDVAIADGIPALLKKSIILQTFGVRYRHPCQDVENVLIPPYVSPESVQKALDGAPESGDRDIWVFFRGKMEVHPKNISGRFYSKGVRTTIWHKYNGNRKFYIKRKRFAGYQSEIVRSVFCLCPLGWAPWSPRLVESVALGCVPVIIADGIRLPFPSSVPWPDISLTVAESDVGDLARILDHVAATNLSAIQRRLWDPSIRRALLFNRRIQSGDATWQVLDALSRRLHRSLRRSRVHSEGDSTTWR